jgi:hypothetical protein
MHRDRPAYLPIRRVGVVLGVILLGASPAMVGAQVTAPDGTQTYALTPQEKADLLANGSESRVDASLLRAQNGGDGKIHGDVGMMVGTRNTRGVYGDAVVPLGQGATAAFSFENFQTDPGKFRWRRGNGWGPGDSAP